jgi:hypothetical protein
MAVPPRAVTSRAWTFRRHSQQPCSRSGPASLKKAGCSVIFLLCMLACLAGVGLQSTGAPPLLLYLASN